MECAIHSGCSPSKVAFKEKSRVFRNLDKEVNAKLKHQSEEKIAKIQQTPEVFIKSPQNKNANIANFVLMALPLEMNKTNEFCNLEI